ncbi:hypothetical protein HK104_010062, partial [Borealophlyctis nickersoniae]
PYLQQSSEDPHSPSIIEDPPGVVENGKRDGVGRAGMEEVVEEKGSRKAFMTVVTKEDDKGIAFAEVGVVTTK